VSLLSYNELCELVERGVITNVDLKDVNGTSIDVHLGPTIMVEKVCGNSAISLRDKEQLRMEKLDITGGSYFLLPNQFILAHTVEKFYMPADLSAEFKLNSSGARIGLENALATWCDPWWHNSTLTLELKNLTQFHTIRLHDGVRIGQMIFHRSEPVPAEHGYAARGRYNNNASVQGVLL
jgi:deoxycytidine triphosphate deaminase